MHMLLGSPEALCSIDDVIVYGRNALWGDQKHKCRVESVIACTYFG